MIASSLIAIVDNDALSTILPRIHSAGMGQTARVLRKDRALVGTQLLRARVPVESMPDSIRDAEIVLFIMAADRSPKAAHIALAAGASSCWIVTPTGRWTVVDESTATTPLASSKTPVPTLVDQSLAESAADASH